VITDNIVGLYYETISSNVQAQILRDLLVLSAEFDGDFVVNDTQGMVPKELLEDLHLSTTSSPPSLAVRYKTGEEWPKVPMGIEVVDRDLQPKTAPANIDTSEHVGYYLKPQGRDGASLTERYLNRSYPRGRGIVDPFIVLMWG
jgi:hypothetical protein